MQLTRLEEDGLLAHHDELPKPGPGGPAPSRLRADVGGRSALPEALRRPHDRAARVSRRAGATQVDELFEQRRQRRVAGALPRTAHLPFDEQVAALTAILDEDGYLAEAERLADGSWRITEHNCAILTVAHGFSQACTSELAFIRDALPGATVRRVAHLMDGAHVCAYVVSPPSSSSPPT